MSGPRNPWGTPGVNYNIVNPGTSMPTGYQSHPAFGAGGIPRQITPQWAPGQHPPLPGYRNAPAGIANNGVNMGSYSNQQYPQQIPPRPPPPTYNNNASASMMGMNRPMTSLMSYGSPYSSFGGPSMYGSPYSSYGGFGRYGMSPYGLNSMGGYGMADNSGFVQMAEESSRPAFQSIEAIVHAAGSVSMMLESTYSALYSSFRAVIGVAHHFGRMKDQVSQIVSALAIIRSIRWLYRKILYSMGLSKVNPSADQIWNAVTRNFNEGFPDQGGEQRPKSNWPIIMFFAVIFGAPWLIWRLLMSVAGVNAKAIPKWATGETEFALAVGLYDFQGRTPQEVSFKSGEKIKLAPPASQPQIQGWMLASVDGTKVGYVPINYIKIHGLVTTPIPDEQPAKPSHNDSADSIAPPQVSSSIEEEWNTFNGSDIPSVGDL